MGAATVPMQIPTFGIFETPTVGAGQGSTVGAAVGAGEGTSNGVDTNFGGSLEVLSQGPLFTLESVALLDENGVEKAPTEYLSHSLFEEPSQVQTLQATSEAQSKKDKASPPKKKLQKALNDARTDWKVSF